MFACVTIQTLHIHVCRTGVLHCMTCLACHSTTACLRNTTHDTLHMAFECVMRFTHILLQYHCLLASQCIHQKLRVLPWDSLHTSHLVLGWHCLFAWLHMIRCIYYHGIHNMESQACYSTTACFRDYTLYAAYISMGSTTWSPKIAMVPLLACVARPATLHILPWDLQHGVPSLL